MNFIKYAFKMANVQRFAGSNLDAEYSIGEHSYRVALISMAICDEYNKKNKKKINMEEVLKKSLIHDMEETITGDLPSPVKRLGNLREELRNAGSFLMKNEILKDSPSPDEYLKLWEEDKDNESGEVIKIADKLEGMLASYYEIKRGNHYLKESFLSHLDWFISKEGEKLLKKFHYGKDIYKDVVDGLSSFHNTDKKFFQKLKKYQIQY